MSQLEFSGNLTQHSNIPQTVELDHSIMSLVVSAYICGIVALVSRCLTVYTMFLVTKNFGKGLKKKSKLTHSSSC